MRSGRPPYIVNARWIIDNYNDRLPPGVRANDVAITNNYNRSYYLSTTPLTYQESDSESSQPFREMMKNRIANSQNQEEWQELARHHLNLMYDDKWIEESPQDEPKQLAAPPPVPLNPKI